MKNLLQQAGGFLKNIILYQPIAQKPHFVLDETKADDRQEDEGALYCKKMVAEVEQLLRYGSRLVQEIQRNILVLKNPYEDKKQADWQKRVEILATEYEKLNALGLSYRNTLLISQRLISSALKENERALADLYVLPVNKDLVLRRFYLKSEPVCEGLLLFMDGLVDKVVINQGVLRSLMLYQCDCHTSESSLVAHIMNQCLPNSQGRLVREFAEIEQAINNGDAVLLVDGCSEALVIDARGGNRRAVSTPRTEGSVRGSQEAFTEVLRVNTALVRSLLRASDLITEMYQIGERGRMQCAVMYLESVANEQLVKEVRRRLEGLKSAYITEVGELLQMVADHPYLWFPQSLSTERPDRVAANLVEGRVAILMEGSPFAHIVPISFFSLIHSSEDFSLPVLYVTLIRYIRISGALLTTFLPGVFMAISLFHQEALPTDLVLAISAAREQVPFPAIVEIILMMGSFEFIREGGLRIPGVLGPTIGIVGAIILGQAAVMAKIVSPIMIIVVAVTGLASFTLPEYRMGIALRLLSYLFLILGASLGLVGISLGIFVVTAILSSMKSFGVPYLAPLAPRTNMGNDLVARGQLYKQAERPDELSTKDPDRQPEISRPWVEEEPAK